MIDLPEESGYGHIICHRDDPAGKFHIPAIVQVFIFFFLFASFFTDKVHYHFYSGNHQESSEHIHDPGKTLQQRNSCENEYSPEDQSTQDSPEENIMLVFGGNLKWSKNEYKDKEIIHTQWFFNQIGGKKFKGRLFAENKINPRIKNKCEGNPKKT